MFKYGHMLDNGDRFDFAIRDKDGSILSLVPVEIKDHWTGRTGLWIEAWTFGENNTPRAIVVKRIGSFDRFSIYNPQRQDFMQAVSRPYHGVGVHDVPHVQAREMWA